jgi:hypothetical protein
MNTEASSSGAVSPDPKPAQKTAYVVLQEVDIAGPDDNQKRPVWIIVATGVEAQGAPAARAAAFASLSDEDQHKGATLLAVPLRSWKPKRRELDTRSVES